MNNVIFISFFFFWTGDIYIFLFTYIEYHFLINVYYHKNKWKDKIEILIFNSYKLIRNVEYFGKKIYLE